MDINSSNQKEIIWDAHCCVPLLTTTSLDQLLYRHHQAGFHFVSINIGMDMIPTDRIFSLIDKFQTEIEESHFLMFAHSVNDITYASSNNLLAVAFDLEGGVSFFGSEHMVELFKNLGVRQALLAYNRNNALAGGCCDSDIPLSKIGKKIISAMVQNGIIIDCSHIGFKSSMDIMNYADVPVIFSHSNAYELSKNERNLQNIQIEACAQTGGVICVSGLSWLLNENQPSIDTLIRHIDYIANKVGINHVGIGLDYVYDDHIEDIPKEIDLKYWWPKSLIQNHSLSCAFIKPEMLVEIKEKLYQNYGQNEAQMILGKNMWNVANRVWK